MEASARVAVAWVVLGMVWVGGHNASADLASTRPAVDRSTPAGGLGALMDAIERGDAEGVRGSMALPADMDAAVARAYAEQVMWASRLEWWLEGKFGRNAAVGTCNDAGFRYYQSMEPGRMAWEERPVPGVLGNLAGFARGRYGEREAARSVAMGKGADGNWRVMSPGGLASGPVAVRMADSPRRTAALRGVVEGCEGGRYATLGEVQAALAKPSATTTRASTRPGPESVVAEMDDLLKRGDADGLAGMVLVDGEAARKSLRFEAEERVTERRVVEAVRKRFPDERADGLVRQMGLHSRGWMQEWVRGVAWEVDGDVSRMAYRPGSNQRVDPMKRLAWVDGKWRIDMRGVPTSKGEMRAERVARLGRLKEVIAKLDTCKTVGQVMDRYQGPGEGVEDERQKERTEALARIKDAQVAIKRVPPGPAGDRERIGYAAMMAVCWRTAGNAEEAAKWYWADGDRGGAYALARVRRVMAGLDLAYAAAKELGSGEIMMGLGVADGADDPMAMGMVNWVVVGDRATAKAEVGQPPIPMWMPAMRQVDGVWRIDVSGEIRGKAVTAEAERAEAEAKALKELTARVRAGEFKSQAELRKAAAAGVKGITLEKRGEEN